MEWTVFCVLAPIAGSGIFFLSTARFFKKRLTVVPSKFIDELEIIEPKKPIVS